MPNEVFLRTRAGLSALVSSRAAGRILEGALKGRGHSPDDVDMRQMQKALLGPVLHELEGVLPRAGLRRNLEHLARSLRTADPAVPAAPYGDAHDAGAQPLPTKAGSTDRAERRGAGPAGTVETGPVKSAHGTASGSTRMERSSAGRSAVADAPATPPNVIATGITPADAVPERSVRRSLTTSEIDRHVQSFAQIEHVRMVTVFRQDGSVAVSRGDGLDLAALARLSRLALSLLAKRGAVRQMHLGHTEGQLFLFPIGTDLLVVFGGGDLNLGTVTTAFTALALEEEE